MDLGLKVRTARQIVDWTTENFYDNRSPDFKVGDIRCYLRTFNSKAISRGDIYVFYVQLCVHTKEPLPPPPMQVTAYLSRETELFLPQATTVKCAGRHYIWQKDENEVQEVVPNPGSHRKWCFRIVINVIGDGMVNSDDKSIQTPASSSIDFGIQSLSRDLSTLLNETSSTDVELKCGDVIFKAHRCLLSVRSEVFRAMLASDMTEGKTGRVQIVDTEADLFRQFLRYLYTGRLEELTVDTAAQLYVVGDKYNVEELKRQCASFMTENLSPDNACGILSLADRHNDDDLKEIAIVYILDRKIPLRDDIWSDFCNGHPELAIKILNRSFKLKASSK